MCVFRSRWWVRLRKWRGCFGAWRWKPTQENTAGTHTWHFYLTISITVSYSVHTHTHTHQHAWKQNTAISLCHTVWPWMSECCWSHIHPRKNIIATHTHTGTLWMKILWNHMLYRLMHPGLLTSVSYGLKDSLQQALINCCIQYSNVQSLRKLLDL